MALVNLLIKNNVFERTTHWETEYTTMWPTDLATTRETIKVTNRDTQVAVITTSTGTYRLSRNVQLVSQHQTYRIHQTSTGSRVLVNQWLTSTSYREVYGNQVVTRDYGGYHPSVIFRWYHSNRPHKPYCRRNVVATYAHGGDAGVRRYPQKPGYEYWLDNAVRLYQTDPWSGHMTWALNNLYWGGWCENREIGACEGYNACSNDHVQYLCGGDPWEYPQYCWRSQQKTTYVYSYRRWNTNETNWYITRTYSTWYETVSYVSSWQTNVYANTEWEVTYLTNITLHPVTDKVTIRDTSRITEIY